MYPVLVGSTAARMGLYTIFIRLSPHHSPPVVNIHIIVYNREKRLLLSIALSRGENGRKTEIGNIWKYKCIM